MKVMTSEAKVDLPEPGRRARQLAAREAASVEAMAASARRAVRGRDRTLLERVAAAQKDLAKNLAGAREVLDGLSDTDLNVYLLAEEVGQARKGVLQGYPPAGATLRAQYTAELAAQRPAAEKE